MKTRLRSLKLLIGAASLLPVLAFAGPVNINTADAPTLARELDGIGMALAQSIIDYREKNGAFKSADELANVRGIGSKVVDRNRDSIQVGAAPAGKSKTPPAAQ